MSKNKWLKVTGDIGPNGDVRLFLDGKKYNSKRNIEHACEFFDVRIGGIVIGVNHKKDIAYGRDDYGIYLTAKTALSVKIKKYFHEDVYLRPNWKFHESFLRVKARDLEISIDGAENLIRNIRENIKSLKKKLRQAKKKMEKIPE